MQGTVLSIPPPASYLQVEGFESLLRKVRNCCMTVTPHSSYAPFVLPPLLTPPLPLKMGGHEIIYEIASLSTIHLSWLVMEESGGGGGSDNCVQDRPQKRAAAC